MWKNTAEAENVDSNPIWLSTSYTPVQCPEANWVKEWGGGWGRVGPSHKRKLVCTLVCLWPMWCVPNDFVSTMESPQLLNTTWKCVSYKSFIYLVFFFLCNRAIGAKLLAYPKLQYYLRILHLSYNTYLI